MTPKANYHLLSRKAVFPFFKKISFLPILLITFCWLQAGNSQEPYEADLIQDYADIRNSKTPADFITIPEAVSIALQNRHEIKAIEHQVRKSHSELKAAGSGWYPRLDLLSRVSRNEAMDDFEPIILNLNEFGLDQSLFPEKNIPDYRAEGGIRLTQLLYSGGRTSNQTGAAKENYLATELKKTIAYRQISLTTILACWDLKLAQTLLDITQKAEKQLADLCQKINNRFKKGTVSKLEWQRAESELISVRLAVARSLRETRSAMDEVVKRLGLNRNDIPDVIVIDEVSPVPELTDIPLEKIIFTALKTRPEILELEKQIQAQTHNIEWEKSRYFPTIALEGEYAWIGYDERDPGTAIGDLKNDFWSVAINYRMNLFQGGQTYYTVSAGKEQLSDLNEKLKGLKKTIAGDIEQYFNVFQKQLLVVKTVIYHQALEKENLDMVLEEFRLGVASIDKIADYHERLLNAHREYTIALIKLQKINARFRWASGMELP